MKSGKRVYQEYWKQIGTFKFKWKLLHSPCSRFSQTEAFLQTDQSNFRFRLRRTLFLTDFSLKFWAVTAVFSASTWSAEIDSSRLLGDCFRPRLPAKSSGRFTGYINFKTGKKSWDFCDPVSADFCPCLSALEVRARLPLPGREALVYVDWHESIVLDETGRGYQAVQLADTWFG